MNEGIHLDLDTWIVPGQIRKANLCRGLGNTTYIYMWYFRSYAFVRPWPFLGIKSSFGDSAITDVVYNMEAAYTGIFNNLTTYRPSWKRAAAE